MQIIERISGRLAVAVGSAGVMLVAGSEERPGGPVTVVVEDIEELFRAVRKADLEAMEGK